MAQFERNRFWVAGAVGVPRKLLWNIFGGAWATQGEVTQFG